MRHTDIVFERARGGVPIDGSDAESPHRLVGTASLCPETLLKENRCPQDEVAIHVLTNRVASGSSDDSELAKDAQNSVVSDANRIKKLDVRRVANYPMGQVTPLGVDLLNQFLVEEPCALSTQDKRRNTLGRLKKWLGPSRSMVEAVTKRVAGNYVTHMRQERNLLPASVNDHVTGLSSFWKWMAKKGINISGENPWLGQSLSLKKHNSQLDSAAHRNKMGWTAEEVRELIIRANDLFLKDFIFIAALSGIRQKELCDLRMRNLVVVDGMQLFDITKGKTPAAIRKVPVHSQLREILSRRTSGKGPDDFLFHEINRGKALKYTEPVSKRFTEHSRKLFPEYRADKERRQAIKDFHSLRRYFITERHRSGCNPAVLPWVVGHEVGGLTFGVYSSGPSLEQRRECVEVVRLRL